MATKSATVTTSSTIGVYATSEDALSALQLLQKAGFDSDSVSVIGKGVKETRSAHGWVPQGDSAGTFGGWGALWGALTGWLPLGFVWLPGIGWVAAAGWLVMALAEAGIGAGLGSLTSLSVPRGEISVYENELKADRYLVIVHGDAEPVERAHAILESATPLRVGQYLN